MRAKLCRIYPVNFARVYRAAPPIAAESLRAASSTAGRTSARRSAVSRAAGPCSPSTAASSPDRPKTGAASALRSGSRSPAASAQPRARTRSISSASARGSVIVRSVRRVSSAGGPVDAGPNASTILPAAVAWPTLGRPSRATLITLDSAATKSTVTASDAPGTDSVAVSPVAATSACSRGRASSRMSSRARTPSARATSRRPRRDGPPGARSTMRPASSVASSRDAVEAFTPMRRASSLTPRPSGAAPSSSSSASARATDATGRPDGGSGTVARSRPHAEQLALEPVPRKRDRVAGAVVAVQRLVGGHPPVLAAERGQPPAAAAEAVLPGRARAVAPRAGGAGVGDGHRARRVRAVAETNWAGTHAYRARVRHRPATVDELREVVAGAPRVRVLGSRHSFTDIADSDALVSLDALPPAIDVDRDAGTVSFGAALRYGELAEALNAEALALRNLASLPHISVAGAVATATHGSGDRNGNLATAVAA